MKKEEWKGKQKEKDYYIISRRFSYHMHSSVVEVDERLGNVPIQHQTDDVNDKEKRERVEQSARLVENRQRTVAEKVDVDVVTDGNEPKGVADQRSRVPVLADEDVIEEELNDVQDDESREIGIEMYIKRVAPLDIFASNVGFHQETVGDEPHCRCDACAQQKAVDKDCVDEELDEAQH